MITSVDSLHVKPPQGGFFIEPKPLIRGLNIVRNSRLDYAGVMRKLIIFILLFFTAAGNSQTIYRTVDGEGNVIFTDVPREGAEKIELKETTTIESLESLQPPASSPEIIVKDVPYAGVSITSPADDEAVRDNAGNVTVSVIVDPVLQKGDEVVIYIDGMEKNSGKATTFNLESLDRGTHQLRASIRNTDGRIITSSKSTTFHLLRKSIIKP